MKARNNNEHFRKMVRYLESVDCPLKDHLDINKLQILETSAWVLIPTTNEYLPLSRFSVRLKILPANEILDIFGSKADFPPPKICLWQERFRDSFVGY